MFKGETSMAANVVSRYQSRISLPLGDLYCARPEARQAMAKQIMGARAATAKPGELSRAKMIIL